MYLSGNSNINIAWQRSSPCDQNRAFQSAPRARRKVTAEPLRNFSQNDDTVSRECLVTPAPSNNDKLCVFYVGDRIYSG